LLSLRRQPLHGSVIEKSNSDNYVPDVLLSRKKFHSVVARNAQGAMVLRYIEYGRQRHFHCT
jgi:hypothetical protein